MTGVVSAEDGTYLRSIKVLLQQESQLDPRPCIALHPTNCTASHHQSTGVFQARQGTGNKTCTCYVSKC